MPASPDQVFISCHVDRALADRFKAWSRASGKQSAAAALREMVVGAVDGQEPKPPSGGSGYRLTVRLKDRERDELVRAAEDRGVTPATWLRSLAVAHLGRRPQWTDAELDALRRLFDEVRRIGHNINQVAKAMNTAVHTGEYPQGQADAVRELVAEVRTEMRRIVSVTTGNFDYWGLPHHDRPIPSSGAVAQDAAETRRVRAERRLRPRRRPARFADD